MAKRRGHGEGAIYQRQDGTWCAILDLGYVSGKRRRRWLYGKTRKEMDIYGHVLPSTQRAAAAKLDALLGDTGKDDDTTGIGGEPRADAEQDDACEQNDAADAGNKSQTDAPEEGEREKA